MCAEPTFTYVTFPCYVGQGFYIIQTQRWKLKYLTGLLNSLLIKFWLSIAGKKQGTQFQVDAEPLLQVPIITASELIEQKVIAFVDRISNYKCKIQRT